jgi:hypothetical protein
MLSQSEALAENRCGFEIVEFLACRIGAHTLRLFLQKDPQLGCGFGGAFLGLKSASGEVVNERIAGMRASIDSAGRNKSGLVMSVQKLGAGEKDERVWIIGVDLEGALEPVLGADVVVFL